MESNINFETLLAIPASDDPSESFDSHLKVMNLPILKKTLEGKLHPLKKHPYSMCMLPYKVYNYY